VPALARAEWPSAEWRSALNSGASCSQAKQCGVLAQLLADVRVRGVLDDQLGLRALAAPEEMRGTLLGYYRGVLKGGHRVHQTGNDRRAFAAIVPRAQRDHRVSTGRVQGTCDEVGLTAEAGVQAAVYVACAGLV